MSKIKGTIVLIILAVSWCALFWLTGSRTPWNSLSVQEGTESISVFLGDVPVENYDRMGFTKGLVRSIESEKGWLVGTDRGELFLFDGRGRELWKRSLGIGKLVSMAVAADEGTAFIGEQSPEGNLYAVNVHTGDIKWKYAAADFVGADASKRSYPSIVHIAVDGEDNVYANAYRFLMRSDGSRGYSGKTLAVRKDGSIFWKFPADTVIDSWINWCDVNDKNGRVVISTSAYDFREDMKYKDTMYFVDKNTGEELNSVFVPAEPPFNNTVMRSSPNFSPDGKYLAACCSDGRAFLFDETGKTVWLRNIARPEEIGTSWINASGRDGYVLKEGVLFTTINTFNRENWQLPTPVEHPANNSIFLFNIDGTFKYQYKALATVEEIAFAEGLAACAVGRNVRTHDYKAHGALILDLESGTEREFFPAEGPMEAIAINREGTALAGIEAPAMTPEGRIIGAYRLHIWNLAKGL